MKLSKRQMDFQFQFENSFEIVTREDSFLFDKVIVTTGGQPKRSGLEWLEKIGRENIISTFFTAEKMRKLSKCSFCDLQNVD